MLFKRRKPKDTIKKFETVAELKYQAGLSLIDAGDTHTGVELLAYAAEMWLKSAYFRFMKAQIGLVRTTSEVTSQHLRAAASQGVQLGVIGAAPDAESYHSLLFWATLLVEVRKSQSRPLIASTEKDFLSRARQMHQMWMIENRCQPKDYDYNDVLRMQASVTWLRSQHRELWR